MSEREISFIITDEEAKIIEAFCDEENISTNQFFSLCLDNYIKTHNVSVPKKTSPRHMSLKEINEVISEIRG